MTSTARLGCSGSADGSADGAALLDAFAEATPEAVAVADTESLPRCDDEDEPVAEAELLWEPEGDAESLMDPDPVWECVAGALCDWVGLLERVSVCENEEPCDAVCEPLAVSDCDCDAVCERLAVSSCDCVADSACEGVDVRVKPSVSDCDGEGDPEPV